MTLHTRFLPCPCVDPVLAFPHRIRPQQNSDRLPRDVPTAHADRNILQTGMFGPLAEQLFILTEIDIAMIAEIGSEEEDTIRMFALHRGSTGGEDCIDSAYAVTNLPTGFEYIIGLQHEC